MRYMLALGFDLFELSNEQLEILLRAKCIERVGFQPGMHPDELLFKPANGFGVRHVELMCQGGNA